MKNILIFKKWINRFCLISKIILIIFVLQKNIYVIQNSFDISAYAVLQIPKNSTTCSDSNCGKCDDYSSCENTGCYWDGSDCRSQQVEPPEQNNDQSSKGSLIPKYPTTNGSGKINLNENLTVGNIVTALLPYVFVIAGLILLVMLIMGGLGLMMAAGNADKMKAGYGRITNALIGFLIIFISYFVVQLVETILGVKIL